MTTTIIPMCDGRQCDTVPNLDCTCANSDAGGTCNELDKSALPGELGMEGNTAISSQESIQEKAMGHALSRSKEIVEDGSCTNTDCDGLQVGYIQTIPEERKTEEVEEEASDCSSGIQIAQMQFDIASRSNNSGHQTMKTQRETHNTSIMRESSEQEVVCLSEAGRSELSTALPIRRSGALSNVEDEVVHREARVQTVNSSEHKTANECSPDKTGDNHILKISSDSREEMANRMSPKSTALHLEIRRSGGFRKKSGVMDISEASTTDVQGDVDNITQIRKEDVIGKPVVTDTSNADKYREASNAGAGGEGLEVSLSKLDKKDDRNHLDKYGSSLRERTDGSAGDSSAANGMHAGTVEFFGGGAELTARMVDAASENVSNELPERVKICGLVEDCSIQANAREDQTNRETQEIRLENPELPPDSTIDRNCVDISSREAESLRLVNECGIHVNDQQGAPSCETTRGSNKNPEMSPHPSASGSRVDMPSLEANDEIAQRVERNSGKGLLGANAVSKPLDNKKKNSEVYSRVSSTTQIVANVSIGTSTTLKASLTATRLDSCERDTSSETQIVGKETRVNSHEAPNQKTRRIIPVAVMDSLSSEAQPNALSVAQVDNRVAQQKLSVRFEDKIGTTEELRNTDPARGGSATGSIHDGARQNRISGPLVELKILGSTVTNPRDRFENPTASAEAGGESADDELDETSDLGDGSSTDSDEEDLEDSYGPGEVLAAEDVPVLLDQLQEVECAAYEAQESLEDESITRVREEVRAELAETMKDSELDSAVEEEMNVYIETWEEKYDDLQQQSSILQEKLEILGVDLPAVFKHLEKLASEGCVTETWKRRTHWAGSEATREVAVAVKNAEEDLEIHHPMRSQRGKLTAGGASGFLAKKLAAQAGCKRAAMEQKSVTEAGEPSLAGTSNFKPLNDNGWSKVDDVLDTEDPAELGKTVGRKGWAAVYLVSTPEQAASMGLTLPGVNSVEEIGDLETERRSVYKAAAANESKFTDRQKIPLKKVREEDDIKKERHILKRSHYSRKRPRNSHSQLRPVKRLAPGRVQEANLEAVRDLKGQELVVLRHPGLMKDQEEKKDSQTAASVIGLSSDDSGIQKIAYKDVPPSDLGNDPQEAVEHGGEASHHLAKLADRHASSGELETTLENDVRCERIGSPDIEGKRKITCDRDSGGPTIPTRAVEGGPSGSQKDGTVRKRIHDEEMLTSDDDNEASAKKFKIRSVPEDHFSGEEQQGGDPPIAERQLVSHSFNGDGMHLDVQCTTTKYRTTVIIDSDGEREVEEAVNDATTHFSKPGTSLSLARKGEGKGSVCEVKEETSQSGESGGDQKRKVQVATSEKRFEDFPCTACGKLLKRKNVMRHPKLPVGICKKCRNHYLSGPFNKGSDGSEAECSWCGEGGEVVCCDECDKVFCQDCIRRNFGRAEVERIIFLDEWKCYICNPLALYKLEEQINQVESENQTIAHDGGSPGTPVDVAEISNDQDDADRQFSKGKRRKNIRKVLDDDELEEKHKEMIALEKERQERLDHWRLTAGHSSTSKSTKSQTLALTVSGKSNDENSGLINTARAENEEVVMIDSHLVRVLKDHQILGVRFMWENCIVSEQKVKEAAESFGCILAHSMGLGKTLQVITFIHTVLNRDMGLRTALIVVPLNVLHNWRREFEIWQANVATPVSVFMMEESVRDNAKRADLLGRWQRRGGVMLIGYAAFRGLCLGKHVKDKDTRDLFCNALQNPGPDILVCDEAHTIKNIKADITQSLKQVKTRRRIALTGSPLQNNLMEYYCMVDFVREGFLGSPHVFKNRFQNPIENGQHADSTARDVRLMKQRAHVLHKQLQGFVQRVNTSVLKDELPPRCVYVISVRLTQLQRQLYKHYLEISSGRRDLFRVYHTLAKIWNHPELLLAAEEQSSKKVEDLSDDFVAESDEEKLSESEIDGTLKLGSTLKRSKSSLENTEPEKHWWKSVIKDDFLRGDSELSGKTVLLLKILATSVRRGDKALVFTQSLNMLTLIERLLEKKFPSGGFGTGYHGKRWYRLDGSTPPAARLRMCESFNDPSNTVVNFMLISTRAGSLGINLPAANRVIIVDGSWNPTHDLQALFRAWRLGQNKPVYAYRFLAHGTMEEKIYGRQVAKEGVAARVLDEQQVGRHFAGDDLEFLYRLDEDGDHFATSMSLDLECRLSPTGAVTAAAHASKSKLLAFTSSADAPRDSLMENILLDCRPRWVVSYHEHDPLLEHREEETLTKEEQQIAWDLYKYAESTVDVPSMPTMSSPMTAAQLNPIVSSTSPGAGPSTLHVAASTTIHLAASNNSHGAGKLNFVPSDLNNTPKSALASSSLQNSQVTARPAGIEPLTSAPPGSNPIGCQMRVHAKLLSDNRVQVKCSIQCPICHLPVSWEHLIPKNS